MDKKITIPAGIALMVVLAVAGMLAIFSYAASPIEAAVSGISADAADANTGTGTLTVTLTADETIAASTNVAVTLPADFTAANTTDGAVVTVGGTSQPAEDTTVANGVVSFATNRDITVAAGTPVVLVEFTIAIAGVTAPEFPGSYEGLALSLIHISEPTRPY